MSRWRREQYRVETGHGPWLPWVKITHLASGDTVKAHGNRDRAWAVMGRLHPPTRRAE